MQVQKAHLIFVLPNALFDGTLVFEKRSNQINNTICYSQKSLFLADMS